MQASQVRGLSDSLWSTGVYRVRFFFFKQKTAYEIRNPLTSIRSTVQYLLGEFDEEHAKRPLVEGVISEVDRINQTVDGLLSLTRRVEFKPERLALGQLIEQSLLLIGTKARNQSVEITWSQPA